MNRITKLLGILLLLMLICFSGCSEKEKTELQFRITWDKHSGRGDAISKIVSQYNEMSKDTNVTLVGGNEDRNIYLEELSEDVIDVYAMPYRNLHDKAISDELSSTAIIFEDEYSHYYETIVDILKYEEDVKGVPWIGHSMALIYNKDLMNQIGVTPEKWTSLEDLVNASEAIVSNTHMKGLGLVGADHHDLTWMLSQFIYSFDGKLVNLDNQGLFDGYAIGEAESIKAIDFYVNTLGKFAQEGWEEDTGVEVMEAFRNSEIAMEIQGPWGVSDIWKSGDTFEVGVISLEQIGMYSEVGPIVLTLSKDTDAMDEAIEFIEYMISVEALEKIMDGEYSPKHDAYYPFRVPLRKDMETSTFFRKYPEYLAFIEGFKLPSINTPSPEWVDVREDKYPYYIHQVILGDLSIEEAVERMVEED